MNLKFIGVVAIGFALITSSKDGISGVVEVAIGNEDRSIHQIKMNNIKARTIPINLAGWSECFAKAEEIGTGVLSKVIYGDLTCETNSGVKIYAQCTVDASSAPVVSSVIALGGLQTSKDGVLPISIICKKDQ
jgi:hypothetical protein